MNWYKHLLRFGYPDTVASMRHYRERTLELWDCQPQLKDKFVKRMALIASESGTDASLLAKQVMCGLHEAGYSVDLIAFGYLIGCIQLIRDGEDISDEEMHVYASKVLEVEDV